MLFGQLFEEGEAGKSFVAGDGEEEEAGVSALGEKTINGGSRHVVSFLPRVVASGHDEPRGVIFQKGRNIAPHRSVGG